MHKLYRYYYFYDENLNNVYHFSVKPLKIQENNQNEDLSEFSNKSDKKVAPLQKKKKKKPIS